MIKIVKRDDFINHLADFDIIVVGTNTCYNMRHGFQRQIMLNYPYVYEANIQTKYGDKRKMGKILECSEKSKPTFVLCFINDGINTRPDIKKDYLSYESLDQCLKLINRLYKGKKIGMTFIGCSRFDGNGDKDKVIDIIRKDMANTDVTVFDYEQKSRDEMVKEIHDRELEIKSKDINLYYKVVAERKDKERKIKELNGHAKK